MRSIIVILGVAYGFVLALGCGNRPAREVCELAADHFEHCIGEVICTDMQAAARARREIGAGAAGADPGKIAEKCEPTRSCSQCLDCLDGYPSQHPSL